MEQLKSFADSRLKGRCIYCGGRPETRDHIPSKCLLDKQYPSNMHVVDCCYSCNQSFSKDEEYFVCLIESVLCGSTDPDMIRRPSVARIMKDQPALRNRIEKSQIDVDGQIAFEPEIERVNNVMLKLARGHASYELDHPSLLDPDHFWCGPLHILPEDVQETFNSVHIQQNIGEVGSRNMQRQLMLGVEMLSNNNLNFVVNDWIDVQFGQYRFIAIDDIGMLIIRIVISEYFACEVAWKY